MPIVAAPANVTATPMYLFFPFISVLASRPGDEREHAERWLNRVAEVGATGPVARDLNDDQNERGGRDFVQVLAGGPCAVLGAASRARAGGSRRGDQTRRLRGGSGSAWRRVDPVPRQLGEVKIDLLLKMSSTDVPW